MPQEITCAYISTPMLPLQIAEAPHQLNFPYWVIRIFGSGLLANYECLDLSGIEFYNMIRTSNFYS